MRHWTRAVVKYVVVGTVVAVFLAWGLPARSLRAAPPDAISVETHVIMASKGKVEHVDASLKEVAVLLKRGFKGVFNRFRLHRTVTADVVLQKENTVGLIDKYYLRVKYRGAKTQEDKSQKMQVTYTLLKRVKVTVDGKIKDKDVVLQSVNYTVPPGLFVLIAGPKVGEETMILAIRVQK
jgi:phosphate-selective porin